MCSCQSYIRFRPARWPVWRESAGSETVNKALKLKIQLKQFPSVIGHCSSRINRWYNEDTYAINLLWFATPSAERRFVRQNEQLLNSLSSPTVDQVKQFPPLTNWVLNMSIFDGHGGHGKVSKQLAEELPTCLTQYVPTRAQFDRLLYQYATLIGGTYWQRMYELRDTFYDKFIKNCNTKQEQVLYGADQSGSRMIFDKSGNIIDKTALLTEQERLRFYYTYLKFDLDRCCGFENGLPDSDTPPVGGSTASSIFVSPYNNDLDDGSFFLDSNRLLKLVVTQVGDTKIILCDSNGIAHSLSTPHHPSSKRESKRLNTSFQTDSFGDTRFLNNFANTRSFGDLQGKKAGLSSEPDIYSYLIGSTSQLPYSEKSKLQFGGEECFIALVTDGVSSLLSDQEIVDLVTSTVNMHGLKKATPQYVSEEVIKYIAEIGGRHADNATCLVLRLKNWGNWPELDRTGAQREEKLMTASQGDKTE